MAQRKWMAESGHRTCDGAGDYTGSKFESRVWGLCEWLQGPNRRSVSAEVE